MKELKRQKESLYCKPCDKKFESVDKYQAHYRRVHKEVFPCSKCERRFTKRTLYEEHLKVGALKVPLIFNKSGRSYI